MSQIICKDLTLGYEGNVVCSGLDLVVEKGDYLCIVGDNGSGKTTFMRALLSLKPALSGTISFGDGISARDIGYLPQQTELQKDFPASVEEVVISGCTSRLGKRFFMGQIALLRVLGK
jgi:zinc transport system ATP-binding protein